MLAAGTAARLSVSDLSALGVRRVSSGSGIARAILAATANATREIAQDGTFGYLTGATSGDEFDRFFARRLDQERPTFEPPPRLG